MPFFEWRSHRLHYAEAGGPGRPLVLILPGSTASAASHRGDMRHFRAQYHVVALDYLGTGRSERLAHWPIDWWEQAAEQTVALVEHLGSPPTALVGCSGGGMVALLAAADHPDAVSAVIADSSPDRLTADDLRRVVRQRHPELADELLPPAPDQTASAAFVDQPIVGSATEAVWRELARQLSRPANKFTAAFWRQAHGRDWPDVVAADGALMLELAARGGWDVLGERLAGVRCPVLLTGGAADPEIPDLDAQQAAMAQRIPVCRRWTSASGGHPSMWTDRRGFRRAAAQFLAETLG